jgi:hypothetical protein
LKKIFVSELASKISKQIYRKCIINEIKSIQKYEFAKMTQINSSLIEKTIEYLNNILTKT